MFARIGPKGRSGNISPRGNSASLSIGFFAMDEPETVLLLSVDDLRGFYPNIILSNHLILVKPLLPVILIFYEPHLNKKHFAIAVTVLRSLSLSYSTVTINLFYCNYSNAHHACHIFAS